MTLPARIRPLSASQSASSPKTAASPSRSEVESKKAPQLLDFPVILAIRPSIMSEITKMITTTTPCQSQPCGKQINAPSTTPRVPMIVTTSGETPSLTSRRAIGPSTVCDSPRKRSSISWCLRRRTSPSYCVRSPRFDQGAGAKPWSGRPREGSWHRPTSAAPRADASGPQCRHPRRPLVDAEVEAGGALAARKTRIAS